MTYHDHSDMQYLKTIGEGYPDGFKAFARFDEAALRGKNKELSRKTTELIALAVGLTTQCVYCIEAHVAAAKEEGATLEEISEVTLITAALRAGGGMTHGALAVKLFTQDD